MVHINKGPTVNIEFKKPKKIFVIPDMQIKPNIDLRFVHAIGRYIVDKKPDFVVNLGDMADMPSLSSYDKGKKSFEGKRYKNDVESVRTAQEILFDPLKQYNLKIARKNPDLIYNPETIFLEGNHEERIRRAIELDSALDGTMDLEEDLKLYDHWHRVYDFLRVVTVQGIAFSHYFGTGVMNRPASTSQVQLNKMHMSCISGHQPGRQTSTGRAADGRLLTSIIAGSSYDYQLDYMGVQGNKHWRGVLMLHNALNGSFDEVYIPTQYLLEKYCTGMGPVMYSPKRRKSDPTEA
jgi:hypothetical protein